MGQSAPVGRAGGYGRMWRRRFAVAASSLRSRQETQNNFAYVLSAPLQPAWPGGHWLEVHSNLNRGDFERRGS